MTHVKAKADSINPRLPSEKQQDKQRSGYSRSRHARPLRRRSMQPWKVSVGLTVTVAGLATILTHRPA